MYGLHLFVTMVSLPTRWNRHSFQKKKCAAQCSHFLSTFRPHPCHFVATFRPHCFHFPSTFRPLSVHIGWRSDLGRKAGHTFKGSYFRKVQTKKFHFLSTFISLLVHIWFRHWNPAAPLFARVAANMNIKIRTHRKN